MAQDDMLKIKQINDNLICVILKCSSSFRRMLTATHKVSQSTNKRPEQERCGKNFHYWLICFRNKKKTHINMWGVVKGLRLLNVTKYISFKVQFITHLLTKECMIVEHRTQFFFVSLFVSRPFSLFSVDILFGNPIAYNKKICFDFWIMFPQMGFSLTVLCMFCKRDERFLREIFSIDSECCVYTLVATVSYPSLLTYFSMAWNSLHGWRLRDHELTDVPRIDTLCSSFSLSPIQCDVLLTVALIIRPATLHISWIYLH